MIKQICLDIDGVLADFVGGSAKLLGFDPKLVTTWHYYEQVGTTEAKFWEAIDNAGLDFWRELKKYYWADHLWLACCGRAQTILLTSPSNHHSSVSGKLLWMQSEFGLGFRDYLMGSPKDVCARPGTVLIDDSDDNCEKFLKAGGVAILFPRPWNKLRGLADDPMPYVLQQLVKLAEAYQPDTHSPNMPKMISGNPLVREFETGAVRSRDAESVRYDLISPIGLRRLAETYAEGAIKYSPHNWTKGFPMSEVLNHGQRHIELWRSGDTSEDHLAHAAWNLFTLMHFEESRPDLLDIPARQATQPAAKQALIK